MRLNHLHQFLCRCLPRYALDCCAIFPPQTIVDLTAAQAPPITDLNLTIKSYASNLSLNSITDKDMSGGTHSGGPSTVSVKQETEL
jgi:hypothetical protein